MSFYALAIAYAIISYCDKTDVEVENLRLQKLLYLAWIEYYKETGKFLFPERFEAWLFGPVIPSVYDRFACYASNPITLYNRPCVDPNPEVWRAIMSTVQDYGKMPLADLTDFVRRADSPWAKVYDTNNRHQEIPYSLIIDYECVGRETGRTGRGARWSFTFETGKDWQPGTYGCDDDCPFRAAVKYNDDGECIYNAETCPFKDHIKKRW